MKKYFFILTILLLGIRQTYSQSVAVNTDGSKPNSNAIVDVKSTTKGVLLPRMTTAERHKIPNTKGLLVYDTDENLYWYNDGASWQSIYTTDLFKKNGQAWSLKGNSNTKVGVNFIGTKDNEPLDFKVNNQPAGRIDPGRLNTYWGYLAGNADSTDENSGLNTEGTTAIGYKALYSNHTGSNTAVGSFALAANNFGRENAAFGYGSLSSNTEGIDNVAEGFFALGANTVGGFNVAAGYFALSNNDIGVANVAIGAPALYFNTKGSFNVGIGVNSNNGSSTGNYLTAIGALAVIDGEGLFNSTAIGSGAGVDASNTVRIGDANIIKIEGQVPFTTPSDGRFKFNIHENVKGLNFILKLRPVTYQFDVKKQEDFTKGKIKPEQLSSYFSSAGNDDATQMIRTGFIAQEVEEAAKKAGYDFDGVRAPQTEKQYYSLSYSSFVVPLVKAVQEQQKIINMQQEKLDMQQANLEEQNIRIENLENQIAQIKNSLRALR